MTCTPSALSASGALLLRLLLRSAAVGGLLVAGWLLGSAPAHAVVPGLDTDLIGSGDDSSESPLIADGMQLSEPVQSLVQVTGGATDAVSELAGSSSPADSDSDRSPAAEPEPAESEPEPAEPAEPAAEPAESEPEPATEPEPEPAEPEIDTQPAEPVSAPAEPVTALAEPVTALAEPVTELAAPVTELAEPVVEPVVQLAEPVVQLAEPVVGLAEPVVESVGSLVGTTRQPAPVDTDVTAEPAPELPAPAPQPVAGAATDSSAVVLGPHAADVLPPASEPADGTAGGLDVADSTSLASVTGGTASQGGAVPAPCSSVGSGSAGTSGVSAVPGGTCALTPPGPAVSLLVGPVTVATGLLAHRPSTSPD